MKFISKKIIYIVKGQAEVKMYGSVFFLAKTSYPILFKHRINGYAITTFSPDDCDRPKYYRFNRKIDYFLDLNTEINNLKILANEI